MSFKVKALLMFLLSPNECITYQTYSVFTEFVSFVEMLNFLKHVAQEHTT